MVNKEYTFARLHYGDVIIQGLIGDDNDWMFNNAYNYMTREMFHKIFPSDVRRQFDDIHIAEWL